MRLTLKLCGEFRKTFWFKNIWKKKSKFTVAPAKVPEAFKQLGIRPIDPNKELFHAQDKQVWIPPDDPRFMFPPRPEDHEDWKPSKAHTCDEGVKLWEGLHQVQLLTNALVRDGLPESVFTHADEVSSDDQDHLMQRIILQSNLWDTAREKLPGRMKPCDISVWHYKTEFGIPRSRNVDKMFRSMFHKCVQLLALKEPELACSRRLIENHRMHTHYLFDETPIYLTSRSNYLLTSSKRLDVFANKEEVKATTDTDIATMSPMSPLVDLVTSHIYKTDDDIGYRPDYSYQNHHTLFLEHSPDWSMEARHANALLMSYAHCIEQAKRMEAANTLSLINEPICVQTVHTDGELFGYTCFQLNTLVTTPEATALGYSTRRNIAWVDDDFLFKKDLPRRSMLRDTKYKNYNPSVFRKVLGMLAS